ncbi:MAG: hypothetical protein LBD33_04045 [Puniceicoccales bacterium]|nr:hypothetical protein [Puniceicoccales bacterium]
MKKFTLSFAAVALGISSLCASYAKENMCLYARMRPPKELVPKLIRFTEEVVDDKYFNACFSALAAKFGHPNYGELSPSQGPAVFLFEGDKEALFVVKFNKNSTIKTDLMKSGLGLKDVSGWTLISSSREKLNELTNADWILSIAEGKIKNDIEIYPSVPRLVENMNVDILKNEMGPDFREQIDRLSFLFYTLRDEVDELQEICFACNFDGSTTTLSSSCKAKAGSDIGALWTSKVDGDTQLPQMVFERNPYCSIFWNSNQRADIVFSDKINHKILKNCNYADLDAMWKRFMEKSKALEHKRSGQGAAYIVPDGDDVGLVLICGGTHDDADVKAMIDLDDDLSDLIGYITYSAEKGCDCFAGMDCDKLKYMSQYTHRKETVYTYRQTQCGTPENWLDYHICACRGNIIMATSQNLAKGAIDNILDNKTKIALEDKCRLQVSVNGSQIASDTLSRQKDFAEWCDIGNMKPIGICSTSSNSKYTLRITFDNVSVMELGKLMFATLGTGVASSDSDAETSAGNGGGTEAEKN